MSSAMRQVTSSLPHVTESQMALGLRRGGTGAGGTSNFGVLSVPPVQDILPELQFASSSSVDYQRSVELPAATRGGAAVDMNETKPDIEQLIRDHDTRLRGFFRGRVRNDSTAQDLSQETWAEVWKHFETFDENKGKFWTLTKIWADLVLRRHWEATQNVPLPIGIAPGHDESDDGSRSESEIGEIAEGRQSRVSMESAIDLSNAFLELLRRVVACPRPPHEILVFLLSRLEWKPKEITAQLSDVVLRNLAEVVEQDYSITSRLEAVHSIFDPLHEKLRV